MNTIYFSLTPHTYAARFDNAIIVLDSSTDRYLSFIDSAAQALQYALKGAFNKTSEGKFVPAQAPTSDEFGDDSEQLNYWITHFVENNFITQSPPEKRKLLAHLPLKPGGLINYCWDFKPSWHPFAQASKKEIIQAFFTLTGVLRTMKRAGIKGILEKIKKTSTKYTVSYRPTNQEAEKLASAIDAAFLLYPKKTYCLAWAATFVLLALKKNWPCSLVIGIQANPFYAHAWGQIDAQVIHDDPVIAQVLAIILKEPHP